MIGFYSFRRIYLFFQKEILVLPSRTIAFSFCLALLLLPLATKDPYLLRIIIFSSIFAIFAASWDLLSGFTGQMNFGHAIFFGVAAYTSALLNLRLGLAPWLTIPLGALMAVIAGLVVGIPCLRLRGPYLALSTLAFPMILMAIVFALPNFTGGELGVSGVKSLASSRIISYYVCVILMIGFGLLMWKIGNSKTGLVFHAIREDEVAVRASGINTTRYKLLAFSLSGFFAGMAGGLYTHSIRIAGPSTLEMSTSFQAIIWTIFGGVATIYGPIAGVFILYPLMEFLRILPEIRTLLFGLTVVVILLFMPEGLTTRVRDKMEKECPRCKARNIAWRKTCRTCFATSAESQKAAKISILEKYKMEFKKVYEKKPWLRFYPGGVPETIPIPEKSLPDVFDEVTHQYANKAALIFYGRRISFRELIDQVNRFACALSDIGVKRGDRVALLLLNSPQFVISYFGTLKVGAAVTPISPVYTSIEVKHQLEDSEAKFIICQDILYENVEKANVNLQDVIVTNIGEYLPPLKRFLGKSLIGDFWRKVDLPTPKIKEGAGLHRFESLIRRYPPNPPDVKIHPKEDIAVLSYTGGTTGSPKGVMLSHFNLVACGVQTQIFLPFLEEGKETMLAFLPFYHIYGQVVVMVNGLTQGSTLLLFTTPDLKKILGAVETYKASMFLGVPTMYEYLKEYHKTDRVNWKRLKGIVCGMDTLHESTVRDWERKTGSRILEGYGLTECGGVSHTNPHTRPKVGSFGIPLPNVTAAILGIQKDDFLPAGEVGELVIKGPNVMQGYWKKPEETKKQLVDIEGETWLRTEDLVKMDEEGYFYFYDRKKDIIKHKGYTVFARDIEEVLYAHPKIKAAGVIGVMDPKVGQIIKVLVVPQAEARGKISEEEIIKYCEERLASYKVPKVVEFKGELPKTDVGKISRRELREESEEG